MTDWHNLQPTLEPMTSDLIAQVCASLNLDSSVLDLNITWCDVEKREKNVAKARLSAPKEFAVREAANRRLEAVLREHGVHLPPSDMFPIQMKVRHFRLQLCSLGLSDEKVLELVGLFKRKKASMETILWRTRQKQRRLQTVD